MIRTTVVYFVCLVAVTICENDTDKQVIINFRDILGKYKDECLKKSKAKIELVDELILDVHFPENEELKCFVECGLLKNKFMNEDFKLDINVLKHALRNQSIPVIDEIGDKCENVGGGRSCAKAYNTLRCVYHVLKTKIDH
ncbi:hypothetical protein FQR65_LT07125 [Abscondita terminalis]|nr:hypothetical protein FQR65_LT07125 [Abscondita terminalis]